MLPSHSSTICEDICISTVDSDVAILAIYYQSQLPCSLKSDRKQESEFWLLKKIVNSIGEELSNALPALHAISGCDSTSLRNWKNGIGKKKFYKMVKNSQRFQETLAQMGDTFAFDSCLFEVIQEMIAEAYGIHNCSNINQAR